MSGPVLREADRRVVEDLERMLAPERVLSRPIDRLGRSADASIYRLIPEAIVRPRGLGEVESLFAWARQKRRHLTFRTAGTSLSGQAVTDDVLVELGPFFRSARVLDDGARVVAQPGVVGGHLNRLLAGHGKRIGPDPASIDTAMIGGILANNSSGMCCGVAQNSYHTLDGLQLLLAGGAVVDTREPDADAQLKRGRPALHAELLALRDEIRRDAALAGARAPQVPDQEHERLQPERLPRLRRAGPDPRAPDGRLRRNARLRRRAHAAHGAGAARARDGARLLRGARGGRARRRAAGASRLGRARDPRRGVAALDRIRAPAPVRGGGPARGAARRAAARRRRRARRAPWTTSTRSCAATG